MMFRRLALCLCLSMAGVASASALSNLVVFGDSLSDVGNTDASTFGLFPGGEYFDGRFSNGPVYGELLSERLGLGPLTRSGAGGDNFAFGGAETAGPGGFAGLFLNGFDEQVDEYTTNRDADPDALHILWAGANDLLADQLDFTVPTANIAGEIANLHADGARRFLVINLPNLGATPRFNDDSATSQDFTARTDAFNAELDLALDGVEASLADADLFRFDVNAVVDDLLTDPAAFGLANTTDAVLELFPDGNAPNADEFLFFDDLHPTAAVHALLADELFDLLTALPGDLNGDGRVDAADYTTLRDTGLDGAAFEEFQSSFGAGSAPAVAAAPVPEPATTGLVASAIFGVLARGQRHRLAEVAGVARINAA